MVIEVLNLISNSGVDNERKLSVEVIKRLRIAFNFLGKPTS